MANVICIEDEKILRENIASILEYEGFSVKTFLDGGEALDFLEKSNEPPELILCDINLPIVSGYEFIRRLRMLDSPPSKTPVMFLSAMGQKQDIIKGLSLNAVDYLVKPIDFDILLSKIKSYVSSVK